MPLPRSRPSTADALAGIWTILLASFVIGALYFGRDILIPIALATLFTFLLAPLVTRMQRWLGRIGAVLAMVILVVSVTSAGGWVLTRQFVDLATELPNYKENIRSKLRTLRPQEAGAFTRLGETLDDLKSDLPGTEPEEEDEAADPTPFSLRPIREVPARVQIVDPPDATTGDILRRYAAPVLGPLGTAALVLLLLVFMLLKREDLRSRFIRLVGQGRISATTRAMDDAGSRVSRYLFMLLVVNVTYGVPVAIGLHFIGVPNAILWGTLCIFLRFIPYVGPWVGAAFPIILSIIVSPDWVMPIMTVSLFIVLELISNNVMEPWLYGASTGVSPVALIVAAVFWTWLWGPVGLVLATPFTVCLVVMGRHIPRLAFLSILLSDEEALTPAEDFYHRLLRVGEHDEMELVDQYLRNHPPAELYDKVLVPVIVLTEADHRLGLLGEDQRDFVYQGLYEVMEELAARPRPAEAIMEGAAPRPDCRIHVVPARAERDEIAARLLARMIGGEGFEVTVGSGKPMIGEKAGIAAEERPDLVCVSVVTPTSTTRARALCQRLRERLPRAKIVVGFWAAPDRARGATEVLKQSGADGVVSTFAEAVELFGSLAGPLDMGMEAAAIPEDDPARLEALAALDLDPARIGPALDPLLRKLARLFEVRVVMVTTIGGERQDFLAQTGLPPDLVAAGGTSRDESICGHTIAADDTLVVEDLARDRRFANNPVVKENRFRFYAGTPLRTARGIPVGTLCLIDPGPRPFAAREVRLLEAYGAEISELLDPSATT